jgi:hypothetical protein
MRTNAASSCQNETRVRNPSIISSFILQWRFLPANESSRPNGNSQFASSTHFNITPGISPEVS